VIATRHARTLRTRQRGVALVEFALTLPFLLVTGLAVIDLSRAFFLKSMTTSAAREGARVAVVTPDPTISPGRDSVLARVNKVLQPTGMSAPSVTVSVTGALGNQRTRVLVSSSFDWLYLGALNYFGASIANPETLSASFVMHTE
jgi:Flp pilus assembly protein TadG